MRPTVPSTRTAGAMVGHCWGHVPALLGLWLPGGGAKTLAQTLAIAGFRPATQYLLDRGKQTRPEWVVASHFSLTQTPQRTVHPHAARALAHLPTPRLPPQPPSRGCTRRCCRASTAPWIQRRPTFSTCPSSPPATSLFTVGACRPLRASAVAGACSGPGMLMLHGAWRPAAAVGDTPFFHAFHSEGGPAGQRCHVSPAHRLHLLPAA